MNLNIISMDLTFEQILEHIPLRISITDYCNLNCFFCSNEGMDLGRKNKTHINGERFEKLVTILAKKGLKKISITGGDPTLYPDISKIFSTIQKYDFKESFFHTNGIGLNKKMIDELLMTFTKIAVSIHAVNFDIWEKICLGNHEQFDKLFDNLNYLSIKSKEKNVLVEVKYVPVAGFNSEKKELKDFLDYCSEKKFKFKFLNFEPITKEQIKFAIKISDFNNILSSLGCIERKKASGFRGQTSYIPFKIFEYKNTWGVSIEIGCGDEDVCRGCFKSNEIFVTPNLSLKPCHASKFEIDLCEALDNNDFVKLQDDIIKSRIFLLETPGKGIKNWGNYYDGE